MNNSDKKVLIIDPHHTQRTVMASYLKSENFQVETGNNLKEAIRKLSQGDFSCLILDVDLPEMKGYEAVPILKNSNPRIKVIMTTQKNSKELEARVRAQDVFFYFIKSFGKNELKLAIHNAFNNKGE